MWNEFILVQILITLDTSTSLSKALDILQNIIQCYNLCKMITGLSSTYKSI